MAMTGHKTTQMVRRYIQEANLFKNNEIKVNREYQANLSEGIGHNGQSAMIDFVAKL